MVEVVTSEFIQPSRKKLKMSMKEFCTRTGRSDACIYNYIRANKCPAAFKEIVVRLLADKANGDLSPEVREVPVPYVPKAKSQQSGLKDRRVSLHVRVPQDRLPDVRALLSGLGYSIED